MAVNPLMERVELALGAPAIRNSGLSGMRAGMDGAADAAQEIAEMNLRPPAAPPAKVAEAGEALVQLQVYQRQVEAAAVVIKTADAVVGFLLDVHA